MGWFKKLVKAAKKPLLTAAKTALGVATGGLSDKAITLAKSAGMVIKRGKVAKAQKILDRLPGPTLKAMKFKSQVPGPAKYIAPPAIAMPGGAPIGGQRLPRKRRAAAPKMTKAEKKAARKAKSTPGKGGMKDLKALSASWNEAGKPGKWIDWVKSH